jgi:hypothetical protein
MQQPKQPNPANPLPNLSALTLLDPELQSAIDLYAQLVKSASKSTPVDSQRVIARRACKMAQVLSAVSKSAIPPDFYRVYGMNMEIPGADQWQDVTPANWDNMRQRLTSWCRKLDTQQSATEAATRHGVPTEEVLWLAKRGALPLATIYAWVQRPALAHVLALWDTLIEALGGEAALQHAVLVPATAGLTDEKFDDWLIRIFLVVLVHRRPASHIGPLALSRMFENTFRASLTEDHYEAAAISLESGQWLQAHHLIDTEIAEARARGHDSTPHTQQMVINVARALAQHDEPTPLLRTGVEGLILRYPMYVSDVLFGAVRGFLHAEDVTWLVERHFVYPETGRYYMTWMALLILLLDLSGNRTGWPVDHGLPPLPTTRQDAKVVALVAAIEGLPQPTPEHFIDLEMASKLLNNASGVRAPNGLMVTRAWDMRSVEALLTGLLPNPAEGRYRFTVQAVREAIKSVWDGLDSTQLALEFPRRLELLRNLVARYPPAMRSQGYVFVGLACEVLRDAYVTGTLHALRMEPETENAHISVEQFVQLLDVFRDAGVVFTLPQANDLLWVKGNLNKLRDDLVALAAEQKTPHDVKRASWIPFRMQYIEELLSALSWLG